MFKTLFGKLVAVLVCFAVVMAMMFLIVMRHLDMKRSQELHQKLYRTLASQLVHDHILVDSEDLDTLRIQQVFDRLRVINPRIDVYLLDNSGKIVASSVRTRIVRDTVNMAPLKRFLDVDAELPILGDDPTEQSQQRVFSAAPISMRQNADGYLYLIMRGLTSDGIAERVKGSYVLRDSLWIIAWGLVFALIAGALVVRFMTRPLRQLTSVIDKFHQGGFVAAQAARAPGGPRILRDEISQITETFHAMADRILEQMRVLKQTDATRRELVANISHDLRTPIASLRGYLETLKLKSDTLSDADQRNYLDIALRQSGQLSNLIGELFELAKLDSGQASILREPFMLQELAQDVVQQFELAAAEKGVALRVESPEELPLVSADIGLIERVLRNLLDNAIRHTPREGSVTIRLAPEPDCVKMEVSDTGSGISKQDLPHIFDRFYRGEKSRGNCGRNAGLGLAIAKRILELHDSDISAASVPGLTTMRFSLPLAVQAERESLADEEHGHEAFASCPASVPVHARVNEHRFNFNPLGSHPRMTPYASVNEDLLTWAKRELRPAAGERRPAAGPAAPKPASETEIREKA